MEYDFETLANIISATLSTAAIVIASIKGKRKTSEEVKQAKQNLKLAKQNLKLAKKQKPIESTTNSETSATITENNQKGW